ncbi:hypothetical protein [Endozoicomonas atrinae]|uniref:hypothetical protein n=1 Tax=Endozoicomonas atrinae TaxID=1333660 RepID=UPI003B00FEC3
MSSTVGETGSVQTTSTTITSTTGAASADPGNTVSSGFSSENSVSQTEGASPDVSQVGVSLDVPTEDGGGVGFLAQTLRTKLDLYRASIAYNNALTPESLDLSDTQNLLLSLRGMISDLMILNGVSTIEIRSLDRQARVSLPSEINRLKKSFVDTQDLIDSKQSQLQGASDNQKQILQDEIAVLEAENLTRKIRISAKEALLFGAEDSSVRELSVPLVKAVSPESLESGEEQLDELRQELQVLDKRFASDEVRSRLVDLIVTDYDRKAVRESDRYSENLQPKGVAAELKALLSPAMLNNLFSLLSDQAKPAPSTISNQAAPSEQPLTDAAEGLALILLAEPAVTASEENPVDQPYLGDSLSLEGANNPQAFALLLLKERMSDMQEALGKNAEGNIVDSIGANQLAQLLDAEREVDAMVMEADRDRERYEAAIPKSHPV